MDSIAYIQHKKFFFVGIKGSGMAALAELLYRIGAQVSGSDSNALFYTDALLADCGIMVHDFSIEHINPDIDTVIYSVAYNRTHPQLAHADNYNIPVISYPEFLGIFSHMFDTACICGVHGKTSTSAFVAHCAQQMQLPACTLVGGAMANFNYHSVQYSGMRYFMVEACEYKRNFLHFSPQRMIITSIELDHLDYFSHIADMKAAFVAFALQLKPYGFLVYNADDIQVCSVIAQIKLQRSDIMFCGYGIESGDVRISHMYVRNEMQVFCISHASEHMHENSMRFLPDGLHEFTISVPGTHMIFNAVASICLLASYMHNGWNSMYQKTLDKALATFRGVRRRSELLGEAQDILFIDDYGHHPSAIKKTIEGYREFYPNRRIVLDFMSHTYSRSHALQDEFIDALGYADVCIIHDIYSSAREEVDNGDEHNRLFIAAIMRVYPHVLYTPYVDDDAFTLACSVLQKGDVFISMGAGNNWELSHRLYHHYACIAY